ncbi:F-box/kelch-repeat protein At1g57790-like isoform X1 [Tasmannia lanceolata]|uniref:F-box/kelch-repeat protein At1g57790-like isoform X1 n=1 Tax=Tasmannia lanceolata TaxID=3420 RepID=UPI0040649E7A
MDLLLVNIYWNLMESSFLFRHNYYDTKTFHSFFVFKMDFCKMMWVKVESIRADCIFFLGIGSGCVSYTTNTRLKGDVIYFFNSEDNAFYAFDLEDGSISVNLCDQVGDNVCDAQFRPQRPISFGYVPSSDSELESTKEGNAKSMETEQGPSTTITITRTEFDKMDVEERNWLEVPDNIVELTKSCLFLSRDHIHFSSVFKSWRLINPLGHLSRRPLLLFTHKGDGLCKFFDPSYNKIYDFAISHLKDTVFHFCKDGWLLLARRPPHPNFSLFLFNPFTNEKVSLPFFWASKKYFTHFMPYGFSFSSQPMLSDFIVFYICACDYSVFIYIYRHNGKTWTKNEYKSHLDFQVGHNNPVNHDGLFYCLALDGRLGFFYPSKSAWTVLDKPKGVNFERSQAFTAEN